MVVVGNFEEIFYGVFNGWMFLVVLVVMEDDVLIGFVVFGCIFFCV